MNDLTGLPRRQRHFPIVAIAAPSTRLLLPAKCRSRDINDLLRQNWVVTQKAARSRGLANPGHPDPGLATTPQGRAPLRGHPSVAKAIAPGGTGEE
jgi:hypothetical protein